MTAYAWQTILDLKNIIIMVFFCFFFALKEHNNHNKTLHSIKSKCCVSVCECFFLLFQNKDLDPALRNKSEIGKKKKPTKTIS